MGIPHPSGYPLYVLLARAWSAVFFFLPLPWSASLFSAACAAAACAFLYRAARESGASPLPSTGAAWLFAFGGSFWAEANVQRVYALNALFLAAALWLVLRWRRTGADRTLVLAAFVCGLGASNHLEMGVSGVAIGLFAVASNASLLRRGRMVAACVGAALIGLLPYLYLPLRARAHPLLAWGDASTPAGFASVVLRSTFWERAWIRGRGRSRSDRRGLGAEPRHRVGVARGRARRGRDRRGTPAPLADPAAALRDGRATSPPWRSTARAATSSSGIATTCRRTFRRRCSRPGAGRRSLRRPGPPRSCARSRSWRRSSSSSPAGGPPTGAATRSPRTTPARFSRPSRPGRS